MSYEVGMAFLDRPSVREQIRLVQKVEELGYRSAWITETRLARDAFTILGAFAANTTRITLGTGVVNTWTRGPALMAVTFATLHEMAPGRVIAGLGAYWDPLAWKQGIDRKRPLSQMREYVDVMRRLFSLEEGVTHETDLVQVRDISLDLGHGVERNPIEVPIYLGPTGPKMMEMAGETADGVLINGLLSTEYTKSAVSHINTGASRAGRNPSEVDHPQFVNVAMDDDPAQAREEARYLVTKYLGQQPHIAKASGLDHEFLARVGETMGGWPARKGGVEDAMALVGDEIVDMLTIAGGPNYCRSRISEWVEAGATYPIIVPITSNYDELAELFAP
ncbi:MAG: LLM class flavin-dependent oxidoreductase [Acidimicrobiia bacterium]|nr:LLM class flavin-dependent oxidoreductase [Acidimicrobiia bacterium]